MTFDFYFSNICIIFFPIFYEKFQTYGKVGRIIQSVTTNTYLLRVYK